MSTIAAAMSSSLNPNAPLFIPAAYRRVEDFSPEWWDLVHTTAWFRDHWFRQNHQLYDEGEEEAQQLLPDTEDDLFYAPPDHHYGHQQQQPTSSGADAVLRALTALDSPPRGAPWDHHQLWDHHQQQQQQTRHGDKPAHLHGGTKAAAAASQFIHQPR